MKTATLTTPTQEIMLVELNDKRYKFTRKRYYTGKQKDENIFVLNAGAESMEFEKFELLGFVSDLKESEVEPLIVKVMQGQHFQNYKARKSGALDWSNFLWCKTALESFLSLLETKVMWENPYPKPSSEFYDFSLPIQKERFNTDYDRYWNAKSLTFDKARTIVLVKER